MKKLYQTIQKGIGRTLDIIDKKLDILHVPISEIPYRIKNRNREHDPILVAYQKALDDATEEILMDNGKISIRKLRYDPFAR